MTDANVVSLDARRPSPVGYPVRKPSEALPDPATLIGPVAVDTETSGLFTDDGARLCVVSVAYRTTSAPAVIESQAFPFDQGRAADKGFEVARLKSGISKAKLSEEELVAWEVDVNLPWYEWQFLLDWLQQAGAAVGLLGQNWKFDLHMLRVGTRHWPGVDLDPYTVWDTQITNKVLDPTEPTGLKPTAARIWGAAEAEEAASVREALVLCKKIYALRQEHGPRYDLLPWDVIGPYAAQDAVLTLRLAELQNERLESGEGSWFGAEQQLDLSRVLYRMERRALGPFDAETADAVAKRLEARIEELGAQLPFQPPSTPAAAKYFFEDLGLSPWLANEVPRGVDKYGKKRPGELSIGIARRMAEAGVPGAAEYAEYTRLKTANQMHYRGYVDLMGPDRRLRTNFRQAHVKSDRMSVERFQAQALPKHLGLELDGEPLPEPRTLFLVPTGVRRVNLDLSQAELRIAAKRAGCQPMIELLESGGDVHGDAARKIFGIDDSHPEWSLKRDIAKRTVFGGLFSIGPRTFQGTLLKLANVHMPLSECSKIVYGFREAYPEYESAYNEWMEYVQVHGNVPTVRGLRSWFTPMDWPRTAWNRVVQGSLAVFVADWLIEVERMTEHLDALVLTVHDSVVLDLPEDQADQIIADVQAMTAELWLRYFGISGGCQAGSFYK